MTREEYVAICQKCELRKNDAHKGIVCSLTGEHADFTNTCANYKEDAQEVSRLQQEQKNYQASLKVSGWLAFFLWFGVGFGALFSAVLVLIILANSENSVLYNLLNIGYITCLVAVASMTINAFYKRKENAVSLALTYIAMIALDGVLAFVIGLVVDGSIELATTIRQFIWAGIWGTYIFASSHVSELIPKETRVWNKAEKWILGLYITFEIIIVSVLGFAPTSAVSDKKLMETMLENMNAVYHETPISNDVYVMGAKLEGKELVTRLCLNTIEKAVATDDYWSERGVLTKYDMLSETAKDQDADSYDEFSVFFRNGYGLCWEYVDKNKVYLFSAHISKQEYEEAYQAGSSFKCPTAVIDSLIGAYAASFPVEFVGGCQLESVVYEEEHNELTYTMRLPKMDDRALLTNVTTEFLTDYVHENWSRYEDNIVELVQINGTTICERFLTNDGKEHAVVRISSDEY